MIYLASPYSHPDPHVRLARFQLTMVFVQERLQRAQFFFSPIVYAHVIAETHNLPGDAEWWWKFNLHLLEKSDYLAVLKLPGWQESKGVTREIEWATNHRRIVEYFLLHGKDIAVQVPRDIP